MVWILRGWSWRGRCSSRREVKIELKKELKNELKREMEWELDG